MRRIARNTAFSFVLAVVAAGPVSPPALAREAPPWSPVGTFSIVGYDPDPNPEGWTKEGRQFSIMNARGEVATHTGPRASDWATPGACSRRLHVDDDPEPIAELRRLVEKAASQRERRRRR